MIRYLVLSLLLVLACPFLQAEVQNLPLIETGSFIKETPKAGSNWMFAFLPDTNGQHKTGIVLRPRQAQNRTLPFLLAIVSLFGFAVLSRVYPRYDMYIIRSFLGLKTGNRLGGEQAEQDRRASYWYQFLFLVSTGFLAYNLSGDAVQVLAGESKLFNVALIWLGCLGLYQLRHYLIRMVGWIFRLSDEIKQYSIGFRKVKEFLGLFLFPLSILIFISAPMLHLYLLRVALGGTFLVVLFEYLKSMGLLRKMMHIHFVHFLLYLCAFEVIPLLVLVRWFSQQGSG